MYNVNYYSRRGRTIDRKKVDSGQVINPRLIPIYYNYLKDNGLFPAPPPGPPVHVDDGTCIAFDYSPAQSYSFPEVNTSLTDALGTLLFNLSIDVDIAKVDHIVLSFYVTSSAPSSIGNVLFFSDSSNSYRVTAGDHLTSGENYDTYNFTFSRDYSSSDTVFCLDCTRSYNADNLNALITPSQKLTHVIQISSGDVYISRIVVTTLTE